MEVPALLPPTADAPAAPWRWPRRASQPTTRADLPADRCLPAGDLRVTVSVRAGD